VFYNLFYSTERIQGRIFVLLEAVQQRGGPSKSDERDVTSLLLPDLGRHHLLHPPGHGDDPAAVEWTPVRPHGHRPQHLDPQHRLPVQTADDGREVELQGAFRAHPPDLQRLHQRLPDDEVVRGHLGQICSLARSWSLGKIKIE